MCCDNQHAKEKKGSYVWCLYNGTGENPKNFTLWTTVYIPAHLRDFCVCLYPTKYEVYILCITYSYLLCAPTKVLLRLTIVK